MKTYKVRCVLLYYFLNPNFEELPIFIFYLKETECNIVKQPSFTDYFEEGQVSLLNEDELVHKRQDKWMSKEIVRLLDEKATIYIVARRKQIRTYNMVKRTGRLFDKIIDQNIPDLLIFKLKEK